MNYTGPKVRLSRKLGINITRKAGKIATKRPNPPGQHGPNKRRSKLSDFGRQLLEKQRIRLQYNISERQMGNYYDKATKIHGNTAENLIMLLETRLDAFIYRSGLASSIYAARQHVSHGHIYVNGRKMDVPSYQVQVNDIISVKEKSRNLECFTEAVRNTQPPAYIELTKVDLSAKLLYPPTREEIPTIGELSLVVEYYSR